MMIHNQLLKNNLVGNPFAALVNNGTAPGSANPQNMMNAQNVQISSCEKSC